MYCDGTSQNVTIYQSNVFEKWTSEGTECFGRDLYTVERLYTGSTSGSITARTDTVRNELLEVNSRSCITPIEDDFDTGDYICDECTPTKYYNWYLGSSEVETGACDTTAFTRDDLSNPSALTQSQVGSCVKGIDTSAFTWCISLDTIMLPEGLESIGDYTFYGCTSMAYCTIPQTVTSIGNSAFSHCLVLTSIVLPNNLTTLGEYAFSDCDNFSTINIPKSLKTIPNYCFQHSNSLSLIDLHDEITSIGNGAFQNCTGLNYVVCRRLLPPTLGSSAFSGCSLLAKIYVPSQSVDVYKSASGWSNYSNIIYPIE
jgi:hypothetical protein